LCGFKIHFALLYFSLFRRIIVLLLKIFSGDRIMTMSSKKMYEVQEIGFMHPNPEPVEAL
jgi:translation elongation factor EF-4